MRFKPYPKNKPSGVEWLGDVPEHWDVSRLRYCASLNPSKSEIAGREKQEEVSFLPMETIGDDGSLQLDRTKPILELESGYTYFRDGDIAIAKITPCFENGKGALMNGLSGGIGFGTTELTIVRPQGAHGKFLNWLFSSATFRKSGEGFMYGAGGQKRVPDAFIANFKLGLPDYVEQSAIATFLDRETAKIDTLIAKQEKLIELLKEKRQAIISHAVTKGLNPNVKMKNSGIEWLGVVPKHWDVSPLKRFADVIDCKHHTVEFLDQGLPIVSIRELRDDKIDLTSAKLTSKEQWDFLREGRAPQKGDMIFCRNASVGAIGYVYSEEPFCMGQDVCLIRTKIGSRFMYFQLTAQLIRKQIDALLVGATIRRANVEEIRGLIVVYPPETEQVAIVEFLDRETTKIDALIAKSEQAITLQKEHRAALISAAVTGKIDVRGSQTAVETE